MSWDSCSSVIFCYNCPAFPPPDSSSRRRCPATAEAAPKADDPRQYLLHILLYGDGVLDDGGISGGEQVVPDLLRRHSGGCGIPEQQLPQQQCVYHLRHQCVFLRR